MTVRKKVEKTVRKTSDNARLLKNLASNAAEHLAELLERLGADASTVLHPDDECFKRWRSNDRVCIPLDQADMIAAILFSLPRSKPGPRNKWPSGVRGMAVMGLLNDRPIRALAREISK